LKFRKSLVKLFAIVAIAFTGAAVVAPTAAPSQAQAATVTQKRNAVVSLAKKQVGKRYVWGATGPNAFDCSGLTSYVYRKAARKNITRTTYTQVHKGHRVSLSHLKKGDLLFWGSASAPYHVGIYVGGGKYVHAATPSQGVRKQTLSRYFYPSAARRVL
jgi:cell wall-associated NlpC family hydrolase